MKVLKIWSLIIVLIGVSLSPAIAEEKMNMDRTEKAKMPGFGKLYEELKSVMFHEKVVNMVQKMVNTELPENASEKLKINIDRENKIFEIEVSEETEKAIIIGHLEGLEKKTIPIKMKISATNDEIYLSIIHPEISVIFSFNQKTEEVIFSAKGLVEKEDEAKILSIMKDIKDIETESEEKKSQFIAEVSFTLRKILMNLNEE